jgi:hypothetical protein
MNSCAANISSILVGKMSVLHSADRAQHAFRLGKKMG